MFHVKQNAMQKKPVYNADGLKSEAYKTSKDYARLKTLLDANIVVVCFINYGISPQTKYLFQDICIARRINQCYQFDARGINYAMWYADFPFTFEEICEANGVEFIEPTNILK